MEPVQASSNFAFLHDADTQLWRLGALAERYFADDPNTCLLKLRQFAELLAQTVAAKSGLYQSSAETQVDLLRRLQDEGLLPREILQVLHEVRKAGNSANHALTGDAILALRTLKLGWQLGLWFFRAFYQANFHSPPFSPPSAPNNTSASLQEELDQLRGHFNAYMANHAKTKEALAQATDSITRLEGAKDFWEQQAREADAARQQAEARLQAQQQAAAAQPATTRQSQIQAAEHAARHLQLDEADTRQLIDAQLRQAGWEADSSTLRYSAGVRPSRNRNLAIAEWPCASGPADYVLFAGLRPVAVVEAKRKNIDVSAALVQAQRYSRDFQPSPECVLGEIHTQGSDSYRIPFAFSANGRPFVQQLRTKSGIWFRDLRQSSNLARPLTDWYTPDGLLELTKVDHVAAHQTLDNTGFDYGFQVRDYQRDAIRAVEQALATGQRDILLAMATGTGKTKTCIALMYRLIKTGRFRRILFLVDRSALGVQAANAFKETRMESLQVFADIFGIKELDDISPDSDTKVHIATVQGMVKRLLYAADPADTPPVDQYDCIVVDECHRGYLLDRELSDTEQLFRGFDDYVSKYRQVLDRFDACRIGLTATPALHTTAIFGKPVYEYSYRQAVIDGYLVDYEPPYQITTQLSTEGISWAAGEQVPVYRATSGQIELYQTPDEIKLDVDSFNKKVITESFNRVVCEYLAKEIDPTGPAKTLVFCATDTHADLVVDLLRQAFVSAYGSVDNDAIVKITGNADKPLELIRRYKNEQLPTVAVTVDLLTTGIDVPQICNLVFLRQVNSRILFDQMLGRATRLHDFYGVPKGPFKVYDAVKVFENLQDVTAMKPVVVNPQLSFHQLETELISVTDETALGLIRDQYLAKLQAKRRFLSEAAEREFETKTGLTPQEFIKSMKDLPLPEVAAWFTHNPGLGEILDHVPTPEPRDIFISQHQDRLVDVSQGFGNAQRPQDYLDAFKAFVTSHQNDIPALLTVLTRPWELKRADLKSLLYELDKAGFTETRLEAAWHQATNQDLAARIIGYIRQAALGDSLVPFETRVEQALRHILASRAWSGQQREWLKKIAAQTKTNLVVDKSALQDRNLVVWQQGGGYERLNKLFDNQLEAVLVEFNAAIWHTGTSA